MTGNQHASRKGELLRLLRYSRAMLRLHNAAGARWYLQRYANERASVPASTRRRWKCGH